MHTLRSILSARLPILIQMMMLFFFFFFFKLDVVNAFTFLALLEICVNHFNICSPRKKREKTQDVCLGREF